MAANGMRRSWHTVAATRRRTLAHSATSLLPAPLLLPVDRKSGGVGDLKYPLVADLKKEIRCGVQ